MYMGSVRYPVFFPENSLKRVHRIIPVISFKEGIVPVLQPQGWFLRELYPSKIPQAEHWRCSSITLLLQCYGRLWLCCCVGVHRSSGPGTGGCLPRMDHSHRDLQQ